MVSVKPQGILTEKPCLCQLVHSDVVVGQGIELVLHPVEMMADVGETFQDLPEVEV